MTDKSPSKVSQDEMSNGVGKKPLREELSQSRIIDEAVINPSQKSLITNNLLDAAASSDGNQKESRPEEYKEMLRLALEASGMGLWDWNITTGEFRWDHEYNSILGLPEDGPSGSYDKFIKRIHPEDKDQVIDDLKTAIKGDGDFNREFRIIHEDGSVSWIAAAGKLFGTQEPVKRIVGVVRDITRRRQAEAEHKEFLKKEKEDREKKENITRIRDVFLNHVAHELRAPLSSIVGWTHMLSLNNLGKEDAERAFGNVQSAAITQRQLIDHILEAAQIFSENLQLKKEPLSLKSIVQEVVQSFKGDIVKKKINLRFDMDGKEHVMGDYARLKRLVFNLLHNALKFTPMGGSVKISVGSIDESKVYLKVVDTGQSIPPNWLPHIFDCYGLPELRTIPNSGLGLGLAVAKRIVTVHGGSIEAFSEGDGRMAGGGGGSSFTVVLPNLQQSLSQEAVDLIETEKRSDYSEKRQNSFEISFNDDLDVSLNELQVLIVDDDEATLELFEVVLSQFGATVKACKSAREVLETLKKWKPDALVCDIGMPEMDGYELIREIRSLPIEEGGAIPAVAVTAYTSASDREKALKAGYQIHAPKPITPDNLARIVLTLVSRSVSGKNSSSNSAAIASSAESFIESDRFTESPSIAKQSIPDDVIRVASVNHLLSSLPADELERILSQAEALSLQVGEVLCQPNSKIKHIYFPARSVISLLSITEDGTSVEVGMTGREGFIGVPVILGYNQMPSWATVTVGGEAIKISAEDLKRALQSCKTLNTSLLDHTRKLITQISQMAVCNRRHQIEARLCTWLLMMQDRLQKNMLPLTQELIASRLGTRRAGISTILKRLYEIKVVRPGRGSVRVLDRKGLELSACECYEVIKGENETAAS